jgi:malate dehydrogenase (oxaloacetate-decarboxylating)
MERYESRRGPDGRAVVRVPYRGSALLAHFMYNKSTAFTREERETFGLHGLLPHAVSTMEQQARRVYGNIVRKTEALERYIGLAALHDRNEILFFRVLVDHLEEFLPIVYTPTVGRACQEYSRIFRRAHGLWITPEHRGRVREVLADAPFDDVRLIVATDNESILGLGDQGAGGMAIPVGKLALYTAAAGIHPVHTLPVSLDVGTDNQALLDDDLYLGWRHPRLRGAPYDSLVDEFVEGVRALFPRALLQWEDFRKGNAVALLERYRDRLPSFNDDMQGTAAMAAAGVLASGRASGTAPRDQRILILGAGAAGVGIARLLQSALRATGLQDEALFRALGLVDIQGLLVDQPDMEPFRRGLGWPAELVRQAGLRPGEPQDLLEIVRALRPTVLIGVSGAAGAFREEVVRAMAAAVERPAVFPLSNPTSQAEATPADVLRWTEGRALVASGSPFDPVSIGGRTVRIGQGNNAFIFPGVGLGTLVAEARTVTNGMFAAAAARLAELVSADDLAAGSLFPPVSDLRRVTTHVAEAVVRQAMSEGNARALPEDEVATAIAAMQWEPAYPALEPERSA